MLYVLVYMNYSFVLNAALSCSYFYSICGGTITFYLLKTVVGTVVKLKPSRLAILIHFEEFKQYSEGWSY